MRIVVTGGRDFDRMDIVDAALGAVHRKHGITLLIEGDALGADRLCRNWAKERGIHFKSFPADWTDLSHPDAIIKTRRDGKKYDAMAGPRRNQQMIDEGKPEAAVAFSGGQGTADMVSRLKLCEIPVWEVQS